MPRVRFAYPATKARLAMLISYSVAAGPYRRAAQQTGARRSITLRTNLHSHAAAVIP
jgi:hypothetical protein